MVKVSGGSGFENTGYAVDQRYLYQEVIDGTDKLVVMFGIVTISYPIIYVRFIYRLNDEPDWEGRHDQFNAHELDSKITNGEIIRLM